jgi:hypothetical protein
VVLRKHLRPNLLDEEALEDAAHPAVRGVVVEKALRAVAAGADEDSLYYVGAGAEGVVFADKYGRAYKVARPQWAAPPFDGLRSEAEALAALADSPAAKYAARLYGFDPEHGVLVREMVEGRRGGWSDGTKLRRVHEEISEALREREITSPEYKEDSYILTDSGPKIVDVGFTQAIGKRAARKLREHIQHVRPTDDLFNLQFDISSTFSEGALSAEQALAMFDRLAEVFGPSRVEPYLKEFESGLRRKLTANRRRSRRRTSRRRA